jgi:hypothetical protein
MEFLAFTGSVTRPPTGFASVKQIDGESWKNNIKPCFLRKPSGFIHLPETTVGCYVNNLHQARSATLDIPEHPLYTKIADKIASTY